MKDKSTLNPVTVEEVRDIKSTYRPSPNFFLFDSIIKFLDRQIVIVSLDPNRVFFLAISLSNLLLLSEILTLTT